MAATVLLIGALHLEVTGQVPEILVKASQYVATYESALSSVVVEEVYEQSVSSRSARIAGGERRRLLSDVLWTPVPDSGWVAFRDVFEVDGKAVRGRDDRLMRLFIDPPPNAVAQARAIVNEGAAYNIGNLVRTLNVPTMALLYLRHAHQAQSTFTVGNRESIGGVSTRVLEFRERRKPRLVATVDDAPASGRFWIEEETGRVLQSEFRVVTGNLEASIKTTYERAADGLLVPTIMVERYLTPLQRIDGRAQYSKLRRFTVSSGFIIR